MDIPHWSRPRNAGLGSDRSLDTGEGPGCRDQSVEIARNLGQNISLHTWDQNSNSILLEFLLQVYRMSHSSKTRNY